MPATRRGAGQGWSQDRRAGRLSPLPRALSCREAQCATCRGVAGLGLQAGSSGQGVPQTEISGRAPNGPMGDSVAMTSATT